MGFASSTALGLSVALGLAAVFALSAACGLSVALGEEPLGDRAAAGGQPIAMAELPSPPASIAALIERGQVRFVYGDRPDSLRSPGPAGSRSARLRPGRRLAATTDYRLKYHFRSRNRWEVEDRGRGDEARELRISVWFTEVRIEPTHTVWFRECPDLDSFWTNRLVLHELDHVRISTDPVLESRFRERLRSQLPITRRIERDEAVDQALVHRIVEAYVAARFASIAELVEIRYQELDRITDHGLLDFPVATSIETLLQWSPAARNRH